MKRSCIGSCKEFVLCGSVQNLEGGNRLRRIYIWGYWLEKYVRLRFLERNFCDNMIETAPILRLWLNVKLKVRLENTFFCISTLNWPQSAMKGSLNNSLENWNFQSWNPNVINFKELLWNNVKGIPVKLSYPYMQNDKFTVYFEYFTLCCSENLTGETWNIYFRMISFRIICFNLNSSNNETIFQSKN